jgi:iron complex outermembrane recepter protein
VSRYRSPPVGRAVLYLITVLPLAAARVAGAAAFPGCAVGDTSANALATRWNPPLNRPVSLHAREISLRDALDRIAAGARLRLSYSAEALPLDRRVCVALDSVSVGDALSELVASPSIRFVVIDGDQVVLSPARSGASTADHPPAVLDRIVVTGSADGAAERALPIALDVLDGRALAQRSATTVSQTLNAAVPGLWMWEQSPVSLLASYGSIRGASSFGTSYPKIYLDGIQVANPLLVTRIIPGAIERIEVIRGPQGAALYGADAISGVANIISRHDAAEGGPHARMEAGLGLAGSDYAANPALQQDYGLALTAGSNTRSASLHVEAGSLGAFIPSVYSRSLSAIGTARRVGSGSIVTGTLRFFGMRAGTAESPILTGALPAGSFGGGGTTTPGVESMAEYTAGLTAKFFPGDKWQHTVVAGVDGYVLDGVPDDRSPLPSAGSSALGDARGAAARVTLRASSVRKLALGTGGTADLTFSAEQSSLRERAEHDQLVPMGGGGGGGFTPDPDTSEVVRWRGNTGLTAQANAALFDHLFLAGGVRLERDEGAAATGRFATLPMIGAAWVRDLRPLTIKVRSAYGKGIRWPEIPARETLWEGLRPGTPTVPLAPEEQSGIEGGIDLFLGRTASLQVTRFDQVATGLIQRVTLVGDTSTSSGPDRRQIAYQLQNVGEITNRGWEIQGSTRRGPLALSAAFTQVSSHVRKLAAGYTGDLRPGDRMLEVPARTMSVTAAWTGVRWLASLTAYRASSWINYDRVALAQAFAARDTTFRPPEFVGANLRTFWKDYGGVTHLKATATFNLLRGFALTLTGDNLLNRQTGEPDNVTVLPGRTISLGVRREF